MWKKFNHDDFEEGIFWLAQMSPVFDGDIGQSGEMVGAPTGETKFTSILAWVEREVDGGPLFTPVDPANHGKLEDEGAITHFAEVVCPADGEPVEMSAPKATIDRLINALDYIYQSGVLMNDDVIAKAQWGLGMEVENPQAVAALKPRFS